VDEPAPPAAEPAPPPPAAAEPPTPPPPSPPPPITPPPPAATLEEKIALVWFTRIGAVALLLGVAYFFKLAVDSNWIGPLGRVAIGAFAGVAVLAFGEYQRTRTRPIWIQCIFGVGLSLLLLSAYASYAFYHLTPVLVAFAAFFVIALLGGALAIRHKAESILILSLAAALAAPVLLSTGEDRPFALFGYILVVTALTYAASLKMQFRIALWLGIAGTITLFLGWYSEFFRANPPPAHPLEDVPLSTLEGAYYHLASRAVPLGFVAAFLAEWLALYFAARQKPKLFPVAILVAAAVLAHAGFAALLYDHPLALGGLLSVLGLLSAYLLHREQKSELLAIPLLASFLVLVATVHAAAQTQPVAMLALLAGWAGVYMVAFLRGQIGGEKPSVKTLGLLGGVGLGFAILSTALLAHHHPLGLAMVLAALSLVYGVLGVAAEAPAVMGAAIGLSFLFILTNMPRGDETDLPFVGIVAIWALVYLGSVGYELLVKRAAPTATRLLVLSAAGLAFAFLAESHIADSDHNLRAGVLALVGLVDLYFGATLLKRATELRRPATVLLGQALGLFAAAIAVLFTGATVTILWAVLASVVVWLASGDEDPLWLAGGLALFAATGIRLLSVDLIEPEHLQSQFFSSMGKEGELMPRFLLNARAYALAGVALAMLVAARAASKPVARWFRASAPVLFTLGHAALLTLLITEIHTLAYQLPSPPTGHVEADEFRAFITTYATAIVGQAQKLQMLSTLVMGLYAAALVGIGFGRKDKTHRYLGLGLFALTLVKLALYDVWNLERVFQILVLVGVGALLLGASFLYARFGKRLVAMIRDGGLGPALLLVGCASALWPGRAHAFDTARLKERRQVGAVPAAGFYRVEIDPVLYRHTLSEQAPLGDVRLAGPDGREVPFLIRDVPVPTPPVLHRATLVDPVTLPDGGARAVLDLGAPGLKHTEVELEVDGRDFLRRTRVEISSDERAWATLADGGVIYRVESSTAPSRHLTITYPTSDARYLRVTIKPGPHDSQQLRITGARAYYVQMTSHPLERTIDAKLEASEHEAKEKVSRTVLDLGEPGVPFQALELTIPTAAFERRALVEATNFKTYWPSVGAGVLYRFPSDASTRIELSPTRKRWLRVTVHDGDDPPLPIEAARAEYRVEELVFRADAPGTYMAYVGAPELGPPSYDFPAVLARSGEVAFSTAGFGPVEPNPAFGAGPAPPRAFSDRFQLPIAISLGLVLLALALWTVRLLRSAKQP
jgi:uncharacterized membrane protein